MRVLSSDLHPRAGYLANHERIEFEIKLRNLLFILCLDWHIKNLSPLPHSYSTVYDET